MLVKCALFEDYITSEPDDYMAEVRTSGSADGDNLGQEIIDQGSTVRKPDVLAVTAARKLAYHRRVEQGRRVNYFGMMDFFLRNEGVFAGPTGSVDPARRRIEIGA